VICDKKHGCQVCDKEHGCQVYDNDACVLLIRTYHNDGYQLSDDDVYSLLSIAIVKLLSHYKLLASKVILELTTVTIRETI
jgi:hypothetical protein